MKPEVARVLQQILKWLNTPAGFLICALVACLIVVGLYMLIMRYDAPRDPVPDYYSDPGEDP